MPFDAADPKFATVAMIDAMLEFFDGGRMWVQGVEHRGGNRCLLGAMKHVRATRGIRGDKTAAYLHRALVREEMFHGRLFEFNDGCPAFEGVECLLLSAREIVMADIEGRPPPVQPRGMPDVTPFREWMAFFRAFVAKRRAVPVQA